VPGTFFGLRVDPTPRSRPGSTVLSERWLAPFRKGASHLFGSCALSEDGDDRSPRMTGARDAAGRDVLFCSPSPPRPAGTWLAAGGRRRSFADASRDLFRGRQRCGNRLSYSNIGDEP